MATHSSILAWKVSWTEEPGRLQFIGSHPAIQETQEMQAQSLGQEDPLEEETATPSGILAWRIPWTEESGRLQSKGSDTTEPLSTYV